MRILYFDCFSGISGDMALASLVDLGADRDHIEKELQKLNVGGYTLNWRRVMKSGLSALKADVLLADASPPRRTLKVLHTHSHGGHGHGHHDHDHGHDHHHGHHHDHSHDHGHDHDHGHHHDHDHDHHDHAHAHDHHDHAHGHHHGHSHDHGHDHHRGYADIVRLIEGAGLSPRATELSLAIFTKIGEAEAKIHGIPLEQVHFHEVGAVDSIVDIVGVAAAVDYLEPDRIISSPVPLGTGTIHIDHGLYPVPAPATLEIMRGLPIAPSSHRMEMTTPTGAAIIAALADDFQTGLPSMVVETIGYGAGTKDLPNQPNVLRTVLGFSEKQLRMWPGAAGAETGSGNIAADTERHHSPV